MNLLEKIFGGSVLDGIDKLIGRFKLSPEEAQKFKMVLAENEHEVAKWQVELQEKAMDIEARMIETVNATMREEAKSEHWAQWLWRPMVGFTMCAVLINNYILLPYLAKFGLQPIVIPPDVWTTMLVVLGAAAATRGWQKIEEAKK